MANFQYFDDQDLWGSSNDEPGLDSIGITEECLMQNVKDKTNYILLDNAVDGLQSFDSSFFSDLEDGLPNTWNPQDFPLEDQTSSIAQPCEIAEDYNLPSQQPENILPHSELFQCDSFQSSEKRTSGSHLQVLGAALPINIQQQASCSVNSDIVQSFEEYDLISSSVLKLDEHVVGSINSCHVPNTPASARASLNSVEAGKKAPRRRRNNCPKEKLYMRTEPFSDEEEEKKRQNAVKAFRNRQRRSTEISKLKEENEDLRKRLEAKDQLLQEKDNQIKAFHETQKQKIKALINIRSEISKMITP